MRFNVIISIIFSVLTTLFTLNFVQSGMNLEGIFNLPVISDSIWVTVDLESGEVAQNLVLLSAFIFLIYVIPTFALLKISNNKSGYKKLVIALIGGFVYESIAFSNFGYSSFIPIPGMSGFPTGFPPLDLLFWLIISLILIFIPKKLLSLAYRKNL